MEEKIINDLIVWCKENFLSVEHKTKESVFFKISGFGNLLLLTPVNGKIIDNEMFFTVNVDMQLFTEEDEVIDYYKSLVNGDEEMNVEPINYFVFQFGGKFYYSKPILKKNSFNEERYKAEFNDLKYVGEPDLKLERSFVNLGIHTEYELLNGSGLKNYIKKAKFLGDKYLGVCDKNTLAGTLAFQMECQKNDIVSIIGVTYDIVENEKDILSTYEVKLYIKNETGWLNVLNLNKSLKVDKEYITEKDLFKNSEGLILVFTRESYLEFEKGSGKLKNFKKQFKGELFFQIDTVEFYDEKIDNQYVNYLSYYLKNHFNEIPPILINDCYYVDKEEFVIKDYLNKLAGKAFDYSEDQYYKNVDETIDLFFSFFKNEEDFILVFKKCIESQNFIIDKCKEFKLVTGVRRFPVYDNGMNISNEKLFEKLCVEGMNEKVLNNDKLDHEKYLKRLEYELEVIRQGGLFDYLLQLWDIISWCETNDIYVGTGRGSVGGSLATYLIGITKVDPIPNNLLFERFLNEVRIKPVIKYDLGQGRIIDEEQYDKKKHNGAKKILRYKPDSADVDVDYMSGHRDIVKEYIKQRFGEDHVCSVGTYTRLKLKGALKDFGRIRGLQFSYLNFITKSIDNQHEYEFRDFIEYANKDAEIKKLFQNEPELIHVIKSTLGQPKAYSIHASAVLVLPKHDENGKYIDVYNQLPVHMIDGLLVSEFEGKYTDASGFLKNDVLGLLQLDKFKYIIDLVKKQTGKTINLEKISYNDKSVFKLFQKGYNEDVFQFNSNGLKNFSRIVKPDNFEDLVAMNAIWRPAVLEMKGDKIYFEGKKNKEKIKYDFNCKNSLQNTYGIPLYQEQIMQMLQDVAGFTLSEADTFRTAVKKFDRTTMESYKEKFIKQAIDRMDKNGHRSNDYEKEANKIWDKIVAFSGYGFNKAHSTAYSMIGYQAQYLKKHFPLQFWTTALQFAHEEEIPMLLSELRKVNPDIKIKSPSINNSDIEFNCNVEENTIYWSIQKIKGIGDAVVSKIINERKENGKFLNLHDFKNRIPKKNVNKKHIDALIISGCFDECEKIITPQKRYDLLKRNYKEIGAEMPDIFNSKFIDKQYFWILKQKALTGFGTIDYKSLIKEKRLKLIYKDSEEFLKCKEYDEVSICGIVIDLWERKTKKGELFIIMKIVSNDEIISCLIWNSWIQLHEENINLINNTLNKNICISGKVKYDNYNGKNSLNVSDETEIILL